VSARTATDDERARWRELRAKLAPPAVPPPRPSGPQRREHARATRKLKVGYAPVSALQATFTEELSAGGLKLRVPARLEPGTAMVLRLELGDPGPLTLAARVAWCQRDGGHFLVGVELIGLRDDERERLEAWAVSGADRDPNPTTAPK